MRCLTYIARVFGLCLICLGTAAFLGCSDSGTPAETGNIGNTGNSGQTDCDTGCVSVFPVPTFPTKDDRAIAAVQPLDTDDGFVTLAPFALNAQNERLIKLCGEKPAVLAKLFACTPDEIDGLVPMGTSPDFQSVKTLLPVIFPVGNNTLKLANDTAIFSGQMNSGVKMFTTKIKCLDVDFTVINDQGVPKWTLPSCLETHCNMCNGKSLLAGSKLILRWDRSKGALPPHGRAYVVADVELFNNGTLVFQAHKPVPVVNDTATYTSTAQVYYDTIYAHFDLTDIY